jgi:hypothetical protein
VTCVAANAKRSTHCLPSAGSELPTFKPNTIRCGQGGRTPPKAVGTEIRPGRSKDQHKGYLERLAAAQ